MSNPPQPGSTEIAAVSTESAHPAALPRFGGGLGVLSAHATDVGVDRERRRRRLLAKVAVLIAIPAAFLWYRVLDGRPFNIFALPHVDMLSLFPIIVPIAIVGAVAIPPIIMGRSTHTLYRPEQMDVRLSDVVGV